MLNKEITFVKNGNVLQLSGYFEYLQDNIDTKVIDGKVYVNTERVVRRITIDEIKLISHNILYTNSYIQSSCY